MTRLLISASAAALFRALIARAGLPRDRILLSECTSTDWQSLTYVGERHRIVLRLTGPSATEGMARLTDGIADAEWALSGHLVADIAIAGEPLRSPDGSVTVTIEALTVEG